MIGHVMTALAVAAALAATLAVVVLYRLIADYGWLLVAWRFLSGHHLDGRHRTNAGWTERGTRAVGEHGRASRWAHLPRLHRAAWRLGGASVAVLAGWGALAHAAAVLAVALALLALPAGWGLWRAVRAVLAARHVRRVVRPLALALAPPLETTAVEVGRTLDVPRRPERPDAQVTAALPPHYQGTAGQADAITRIVGQRLGGEWTARVSRSPLQIIVARRPDPPALVTFGQVAESIRGSSALRPLMGLGAGDVPLWLDFGAEIAHLGVSVGTGGGKSAFLRYLIAQFAYHGVADFPVIDSKMVSLDGMESVPGLRVYRDVPEQWAALAALRADMERRYAELLADRSATFPLCVVLLEEQNDFAIESRAYWREIKAARDPATPPVYSDITRLMIKGRQVGYRVIGVYQRLSAAACGGVDAGVMRDAYGMKALARFGPQAWDSLTGIRPRAASSAVPGRWTVVLGVDVRSVQVPYAEADELLAFALSAPAPGSVPVPPLRAPSPEVAGGMGRTLAAPERPSPASDPAAVVIGLDAGASAAGLSVEAFRKARQRAPIPGEYRTDDGRPAWPRPELAAWLAARPRAGREVAVA